MDVTEFLAETTKRSIPIADLTALAADRTCYGDDVLAAFRSQVEMRATAAQKVLTDAETANRDTLLASEQRAFDNHSRERDSILSLLQAVERRTESRAHVPATQTGGTQEQHTEQLAAVLGKEQRCADWVKARGGRFVGEKGADKMRFGAVVRALALGDRRDLSDLEQRALSEGSDASGGYTVPEVLAGQFIDRVRNSMRVMQAGAVTVPMTSDTLHLAKVLQPDSVSPPVTTAQWKLENADIQETDLVLGRVTFTARALAVLVKLSVELSEDSLNVDQIIEREMSQQLALELDRAALVGSGSAPEPRGIVNQSGVNVESFSGVTPTSYDHVVDAVGRLWAKNCEPNARFANASYATVLAKLKEGGSSLQPLRAPDAVTAVPAFRTNQIPNDGVSPNTTTLIVGDFSQLLIGVRTGFRMEVTRVAGDAFGKLQVWVRAYLRADVQLADAAAFDVTEDIGIGA